MLNDESPLDLNFNKHDYLSYGLDPALLSTQHCNIDGHLIGPQYTGFTTTEVDLIEFYSKQADELGPELYNLVNVIPAESIGCDDEHSNREEPQHGPISVHNPDLICYGMVRLSSPAKAARSIIRQPQLNHE